MIKNAFGCYKNVLQKTKVKILFFILVIQYNFFFALLNPIFSTIPSKNHQEALVIYGDAIVYDSIYCNKSEKVNRVKIKNTQKIKVGKKKSIAKKPTKKTEKSIPVFNAKQIKKSNPTESFSLLVDNGIKAVQSNRERKDNKSTLVKIYDYCFFYEIISDGFINNKTNSYILDSHYKKLFCRPPPAILF